MGDTTFTEWLAAFSNRYAESAPESLAELFSEDVDYHHTPFEAPVRGQHALTQFFRDTLELRRETSFKAETIHEDSAVGWAKWSSTFTRKGTEDPVRQEGVFKVVLNDVGVCVELHQWWNSLEPGQGDLMRDFDA
ncbi:nuclear transport factor 2 family protein [Henriciella sp.]|uniref:nuclear transport factor 2 family protein n=1 Tax=Henriciella sp. TaxID=1968823 RepID=UPI0026233246|nr:nuclear transport factor 2 family protein [Henriciella sp.]